MKGSIISIIPTILVIKDGCKYVISLNWLGIHFDLNFQVT